MPMEDLLRASQDDALHGSERDQYYPQAWAFVHYLMFGNGGADASKLAAFLRELRENGARHGRRHGIRQVVRRV